MSEEVHSGELLIHDATPTTQHMHMFQAEGDKAIFLSESEGEGSEGEGVVPCVRQAHHEVDDACCWCPCCWSPSGPYFGDDNEDSEEVVVLSSDDDEVGVLSSNHDDDSEDNAASHDEDEASPRERVVTPRGKRRRRAEAPLEHRTWPRPTTRVRHNIDDDDVTPLPFPVLIPPSVYARTACTYKEAARHATERSALWRQAVAHCSSELTWATAHNGLLEDCTTHAPDPRGVLAVLKRCDPPPHEEARGLPTFPCRTRCVAKLERDYFFFKFTQAGDLEERLLLQMSGAFVIACTHVDLLPPEVLDESATMVTGPILIDLATSTEIRPWGLVEGLLPKPEDVGRVSMRYVIAQNGTEVAKELVRDSDVGIEGSTRTYFGDLAQATSDAFRAFARKGIALPLDAWVEHAVRMLLVSMIAYTPRPLWVRCWGAEGRYGADVHATKWRDGRVNQLIDPKARCPSIHPSILTLVHIHPSTLFHPSPPSHARCLLRRQPGAGPCPCTLWFATRRALPSQGSSA